MYTMMIRATRSKSTDRQTDRQTDRHRQTDSQTGRQTDIQTDRQTHIHTYITLNHLYEPTSPPYLLCQEQSWKYT